MLHRVDGTSALHARGANGPPHAVEVVLEAAVTGERLGHPEREGYPRKGPPHPPPNVRDEAPRPLCLSRE